MQVPTAGQVQMRHTGALPLRLTPGRDNGRGAAVATATTGAAGAASAQRMAKLADGAHQFEAMMLEQMLKPLKFGESPEAAGDDESSGGANETLQGYGTEALANAISKQGGFGMAKQIIRQVTAQDAANLHAQGKE